MRGGHGGGTGAAVGFGARSVDVVDYAGARVGELKALRAASAAISGNRRVYQQLSWHQRRRTMSHTSHRMPARLRAAHRRELAQAAGPDAPRAADGTVVERPPGPQGKMRCRKYRRRVGFLLALRRLRARSPRWLETHVWHAKRFRMEEMAGGRVVAMAPNDRGLRSGYRAVAHASLAHDASYLDVVEVTARSRSAIVEALHRCMSIEDAARSSVDPVLAGIRRVERVVILGKDGNAIAPVNLLWRPESRSEGSDMAAQMWVWCHPVCSAAVVDAFSSRCEDRHEGDVDVADAGDVNAAIIDPSTGLLTFSLIGPRAGAVLSAVLHQVRSAGQELECLRNVRSAASLPRGCVLALDVEDPRASFPPKRTGEGGNLAKAEGATLVTLAEGFSSVRDSDLWSTELRREACDRAHHKDGSKWNDVPIICMQRMSAAEWANDSAFASGWDIVAPAGWGMAFWISFMYANGARAAGQRELRHIALETGISVFPDDYQDTEGGRAVMEPLEKRTEARHARRPPAKRVNYTKYRIASPFRVDLHALVNAGDNETGPAKTQRPRKRQRSNKDQPVAISRSLSPQILRSMSAVCTALNVACPARGQRRIKIEPIASKTPVPGPLASSLLHVVLRPLGRGVPRRNAVIVLPTPTELTALSKSRVNNLPSPTEEMRGTARRVVGTVLHGDYALSRGGAIASAALSARAFLSSNPSWGRPNDRHGGTSGNQWAIATVQVLFRNVDSLHFRWAVAEVVAH